ncbi:MAG: class I SAM-dependent methyltransferase [Candidatus Pacearchaeota archaeon]|nr:class I SAM-dependent methyltransferase [Candidatus Pacearchaeota archaeon]
MKISKNYKTLIIGCGIRQVKQVKEKCVAVDIYQEYLDKAKELRPENIYVKASVEQMPFPNSSFKKVIFTHVLEHIGKPKKAIDEIYRVMVPGGILFLAVPSKELEDFLSKHAPPLKNFLKKYHKTQFDKEKLKNYLKNFKKVNIKEIKGKDIAFWWLWGKVISIFKLEKHFYIEECGQIHSKKYDKLARQFSRVLYLINLVLSPIAFKSLVSEYQVVATK